MDDPKESRHGNCFTVTKTIKDLIVTKEQSAYKDTGAEPSKKGKIIVNLICIIVYKIRRISVPSPYYTFLWSHYLLSFMLKTEEFIRLYI